MVHSHLSNDTEHMREHFHLNEFEAVFRKLWVEFNLLLNT